MYVGKEVLKSISISYNNCYYVELISLNMLSCNTFLNYNYRVVTIEKFK